MRELAIGMSRGGDLKMLQFLSGRKLIEEH